MKVTVSASVNADNPQALKVTAGKKTHELGLYSGAITLDLKDGDTIEIENVGADKESAKRYATEKAAGARGSMTGGAVKSDA